MDDADAWEIQDAEEGVTPFDIRSDRFPGNSRACVVDLHVGDVSVRCLRHTFFEIEPGWWPCGGDACYRQDGVVIFYRRLLGEGQSPDGCKAFDQLAGADEFSWEGRRFRVWESMFLVDESG